jgi:acyl-CoA dehydrogenase
MDLNLTDEELAFRDQVRRFIAEELSPELVEAHALNVSANLAPPALLPWHRALYRRGWVAPAWPVEFGGTGWSPMQRYIFEHEYALAGAPPLSPMGLRLVGPVIMRFGSREQQDFYLPRILSGDDTWCQGYSEPEAGSDLAALKTRAVRVGDEYILNGTKIWTGHAHHANRMFALVRTSVGARKQEGISFVLIDMDTPGVTVRPIRSIGGDHEVNQVFLDDVRIPAANLVGAEGAGWEYGKYLLEFERGGMLIAPRLRHELRKVLAAAARLSSMDIVLSDPKVQDDITSIECDIDALEMIEMRTISTLKAGQNPGAKSSFVKLRFTEVRQVITRLGMELAGVSAQVWEAERPIAAGVRSHGVPAQALSLLPNYLNSRAQSIYGGSAEIQRNILASAMLAV